MRLLTYQKCNLLRKIHKKVKRNKRNIIFLLYIFENILCKKKK